MGATMTNSHGGWRRWMFPVLLCACLAALSFVPGPPARAAAVPPGYERVAESRHLVLYCHMRTGAIAVEDRRTGYVWRSVVDRDAYDEYGVNEANETWKMYMSSLLTMTYTDLSASRENSTNRIFAADPSARIDVNKTKAGVSVNVGFPSVGIGVTLLMSLEQDSLTVRIPAELIRQEQHFGLISLELMPFFGAADRRTEGYIFYPDGSGALMKYDRKERRAPSADALKLYVYSPKQVDLDAYASMDKTGKQPVMLPVYGVKNGTSAMLAANTVGEEDTQINIYPDGYVVPLNRAGFEFHYRHFYNMYLSNITVHGTNIAKNLTISKADKEWVRSDREVKWFFLAGESANYSGMAQAYRSELVRQGGLNRAIRPGARIPLAIDLFGGIMEDRMLWDRFIAMTTFAQAQNIVDEAGRAGADDIEVMLRGWTKGGYGRYSANPGQPDARLGGPEGLRRLADELNGNGTKLYLTTDVIHADGGLLSGRNMARGGDRQPLSNWFRSLFLLKPSTAARSIGTLAEQLDGYGSAYAAFDDIGRFLYHDYSEAQPSGRKQTVAAWTSEMAAAFARSGALAVEGGNRYVLPYASRLYNIPLVSSLYPLGDESVPFFQMVVHGYIPYSSDPGNLAADLAVQKLKWVEYGSMPHFELTYEPSVRLQKTAYNTLFTSHYTEWIRIAADMYREFNERLGPVWDEPMTGHERKAEGVYKTTYGNGTAVYVNYNNERVVADGHTVEAMDYTVVRGRAT